MSGSLLPPAAIDPIPAEDRTAGNDYLAQRAQVHSANSRPDAWFDQMQSAQPQQQGDTTQPPTKEISATDTQDGKPWWGWAFEVFVPPWTPQGMVARAKMGMPQEPIGAGMGAVARDVGRGVIETPQAVVRGALAAGEEVFKTADDVANWLNTNVADLKINVPGLPEWAGNPAQGIASVLGDTKRTMEERQSVTGALVETVAQWMTGAGIVGKMATSLGVAPGVVSRTIQNFVTGGVAFDPNAPRLSDVVSEAAPNALTDYLRGDPTDAALEGRLKSALEMGALGTATEGVIKGLRLMRDWRASGALSGPQEAPAVQGSVPSFGATPKPAEPVVRDFLAIPGEGGAITIDEAGAKAYASGPSGDSPVRINLLRIQAPQEVKDAIARIDTLLPEHVPESHETVASAARMLGMSADDLARGGVNGEAMSARQITAARLMLRAAADDLVKIAQKAAGPEASDLDRAAFNKAFSVAYGIQQQVRQNTTAIARALSAHRIMASEDSGATKAVQELLARAGGGDAATEMAQRVAALADPEMAAAFVARASQATTRDQILTAWNSVLLSNPTTQVVNVIDTGMSTMMQVPETWVASMFKGQVPPGEATARLWGMGRGLRDGFRLAGRTLQTGESQFTAPMTRVESVAGDVAADRGFTGTFGDYLRMASPLRVMQSGDELMKSINYQAELHAQAYRRAVQEGLPEDQIASRAAQLANEVPPWLDNLAQDAARAGTFNTPLTGAPAQFQGFVDRLNVTVPGTEAQIPLGRLFVATFIRTPYNILSWVAKRTPAGFLAPSVQADLASGGAARDLALARIVTGSAVLATTADFVMQGRITGSGPKDFGMRAMWEAAGNKPYSIRVGDTWVPFSRFGSVGGIMSFAAVAVERLGEMWMRDPKTVDMDGEPVQASFAAAATLAFANAAMDKTFMTGATRLIGALADAETKGDRFLSQWVASWVPAISAGGARATDDVRRRVDDTFSAVAARIPGLAQTLEPALDVWGRPKPQDGGFWHLVAPTIPVPVRPDPISQWMVETRRGIDSVPRHQSFASVAGQSVSIELTPADHNRLIALRGNEGKWFAGPGGERMGAHDYLNAIVEGKVPGVSQEWNRATDDARHLIVRQIVQSAGMAAKAQLLEENHDLRALVKQQASGKAAKITGQATPSPAP